MANNLKTSKTDCLFIHVPCVKAHDVNISKFFVNIIAMGVFSMSNELKKNGYTPEIINLGVEKALDVDFDIAQYIKENNIKLVGMSLHWHHQAYDTLLVAEHIKAINPDVHIFLGGLTSSAFAEDILKEYPYINTVIKGEGEKPVVEFVKRFSNKNLDFRGIPNLYWRDGKGEIHRNQEVWFATAEELNSYNFDGLDYVKNCDTYLKFPMYYDCELGTYARKNIQPYNSFVCCLGRGCSGNCTWCGGGFEATKRITGRDRVVLRDVNIAAKEIIGLKKKYNNISFYFCFDPYPLQQDYLVEFFNILGKAMPKQIVVRFECFGLPTKKFVDAFAENLAPDSEIILSPEFGDEQPRFRHKAFPYSNEELINCVNYIADKKIGMTIFFAELPYETEESKNATRMLMAKLAPYNLKTSVQMLLQPINIVEPYSPWYLEPEKYGMRKEQDVLDDYVKLSKSLRNFL